MTTDITELAQSLKAAAEKATPGQWMRSSVKFNSITDIANPMEQGNKPHIANTSEKRDAEFIAMANPANILALVEALEKAQRHANLTEAERQAYLGLISKRDERIAELESRTVTVSKSDIFNVPGGETYVGGEMISVDTLCLYLAEHGIKWEAE